MKKVLFSFVTTGGSLRRLVLATGLSVLGVSPHLNAQTPADLMANIPFAFQVGPTQMPAGRYVVHQNEDVLIVRQQGSGGRGVTLMTLPASHNSTSQTGLLEFHRYGKTYFLASISSPLTSTTCALPRSSAETELVSRLESVQRTGIPIKAE
jgi:hypothetical protein